MECQKAKKQDAKMVSSNQRRRIWHFLNLLPFCINEQAVE